MFTDTVVRPINPDITRTENPSSELIVGKVDWYEPESELGFILYSVGTEEAKVIVQLTEMCQYGITKFTKGDRVAFRICSKQNNVKYATDLKLFTGPRELLRGMLKDKENALLRGKVVEFMCKDGYGWIKPDIEGKRIFIHANTLKQFGIQEHKINNRRVKFRIGPGKLEGTIQAVYIELA